MSFYGDDNLKARTRATSYSEKHSVIYFEIKELFG
jgi:hypothetical protein